jgi:hypothetical protein
MPVESANIVSKIDIGVPHATDRTKSDEYGVKHDCKSLNLLTVFPKRQEIGAAD